MTFSAIFQGTASAEHADTLRRSLITLARESRREPRTLRYEFYQHADDPLVFLLFAVWESEEDWQAHLSRPAHEQHVASRPEGAWAKGPTMTRLAALDENS